MTPRLATSSSGASAGPRAPPAGPATAPPPDRRADGVRVAERDVAHRTSDPDPERLEPAQHEGRLPARRLDRLEPGARRSSVPNAIPSSSLRRRRPEALVDPGPEREVRSGSPEVQLVRRSNAASSRFAEPNSIAISSPRRSWTPWTSRGSRPSARTATAACRSAAVLLSRSHQSRLARSRRAVGLAEQRPPAVAGPLTDASCPALRSRTQVEISSSSVSGSPASTTAARPLMRSSPGRARRSASRSRRYSANSMLAWTARAPRLGRVELVHQTMSRDHGRRWCRSASGRPAVRRSPLRAAARIVGDQVHLAGARHASSSPSTMACIRPQASTPRRERLDTSRRSRVWSGGSRSSIPASLSSWNGACHAGGSGRPISACVDVQEVRPNRGHEQAVYVGVAGHQPLRCCRVPHDRMVVPEPSIDRIRVREKRRVRRDRSRGGGGHGGHDASRPRRAHETTDEEGSITPCRPALRSLGFAPTVSRTG